MFRSSAGRAGLVAGGFSCDGREVSIDSDGPLTLTLSGLRPGSRVRHEEATAVVGDGGDFSVDLASGTTVLRVVR